MCLSLILYIWKTKTSQQVKSFFHFSVSGLFSWPLTYLEVSEIPRKKYAACFLHGFLVSLVKEPDTIHSVHIRVQLKINVHIFPCDLFQCLPLLYDILKCQ